jgi:hypothetical protein
MNAKSRRTRAEKKLAEQLAPALREAHERLRLWGRCGDTNCQRERTCCGDADQCGARLAPESWPWLRHVLKGILAGASHEAAVKAANLARLPIAREESSAGRASRAGTLSNSCSFTTALGGASIKCRCRRRSIRGSSGWSPCRGCAERLAPMQGSKRGLVREVTRTAMRAVR